MKKIIACFSNTGKTWLTLERASQLNCIDHDCYEYKRHFAHSWAENYIKRMNELADVFNIVFVNALPEVLPRLKHTDIVVFPERRLKAEYIQRCKKRNVGSEFYKCLDLNWDRWLDRCEMFQGGKVILESGEYLSDFMADIRHTTHDLYLD